MSDAEESLASEVESLIAEVALVRSDAQTLYNELYDVLMGESAWEVCDELRVRYPQYEAHRPKEGE